MNTIYEDAVETFGVVSQLDQAQEEAAELIVAISKYKRALESRDINKIKAAKGNIVMELADNFIMMEQIRFILGEDTESFTFAIKCKLKKLSKYIKDGVK